MFKVIEPSWNFHEPLTSIVRQHSRGVDRDWMVKRAACFDRRALDDLIVPPRHTGLHIIALGDYEYVGPNANGDGFTERGGHYKAANGKDIHIKVGNIQTHDTFVRNGRVYRNHKNYDTQFSFGPVLKSAHNDNMKRVELIVAVPNDEFADELQKIANEQQVGWSMACKISHDICSICANKARTRAEYCKHAMDHLSEIDKDGNQIFVYNDDTNFFDISRVRRPADRIAMTIRKVAENLAARPGGAELAELMGIKTPIWMLAGAKAASVRAVISKLADIEKQIPVTVDSADAASLDRPDLSEGEISELSEDSDGALGALADAKICLSVGDFMKLMGGDSATRDMVSQVTDLLPGIFSRIQDDGLLGDTLPYCDQCTRNLRRGGEFSSLRSMAERLSLGEEPLRRRIVRVVMSVSPKSLKTASRKTTPVDVSVVKLACAYAGYQLGMIDRHPDEKFMRLLVLGNHLGA